MAAGAGLVDDANAAAGRYSPGQTGNMALMRTLWLSPRADLFAPAAAAGLLAALLVWLGPPGTDLAAHVYQRTLFIEHGFVLWNNFWYAGRYSFVNYSVLYYPSPPRSGSSSSPSSP